MAKQKRVVHDYYVGPNGNRFQPAGTLDAEYVAKKVKRGDWKPAAESTKSTAVEVPDGPPVESWKNAQIEAWAKAHDVDLGGATNKADMLAAVAASGKSE